MWAQLIKTRLREGKEDGLERLDQQLRATDQAGSGLVRATTMRDQKDPLAIYVLVVFESEEAARAQEQDPQRQEAMQEAQATMDEIFVGPPEFIDLEVVTEYKA